jgi:hypothetical protein
MKRLKRPREKLDIVISQRGNTLYAFFRGGILPGNARVPYN